MKTYEVMEEAARIYVPGALEWWGKQSPDRWTENNDLWESVSMGSDPELVKAANIAYIERQKELLDIYSRVGSKPRIVTPLDAFMMEGSGRTEKEVSRIEKTCYGCRSSGQLNIKRDRDGYVLLCDDCFR